MHLCTLVTVPLSGVRFEAAVAIYILLGCDGREPVVPELSVGRDEAPSSRRDEAGETASGLGSSPQSLRAAIQGSYPAVSSSARPVPATRASPARAFRIASSIACIAASRSP